jgi:hypothetical protein
MNKSTYEGPYELLGFADKCDGRRLDLTIPPQIRNHALCLRVGMGLFDQIACTTMRC